MACRTVGRQNPCRVPACAGQSPVSGEGVGAAACGGSGAQSPSLVLAGLAVAAPSCARSKTGNIYIPVYVYSVYV